MEREDSLLRFFGRGSAFSDEHNSAFFCEGSSLILLDHSLTAFNRLRKTGPDALTGCKTERIYIIVTHTHSDHICGIPLLVHFSFYVWHIPVTVAVGSDTVGEDMRYYLDKVEGCDSGAYDIVPAGSLDCVKAVIPTEHTPTLRGKCFGYQLEINGRKVVYTGDTRTLLPYLPYLDGETVLYTEISAVDSGVHLFIGDVIEILKALTNKGNQVYLMHIDEEKFIKDVISGTSIMLVPLI